MASRDFWLKLKMILGAVIIFALCLGFALWMITPAKAQGTAGPPMHVYMTPEQIDHMTEALTRLFEGKIPDTIPLTLNDPIGELTCDDMRELLAKYCEEKEPGENRLNHPIREELKPR